MSFPYMGSKLLIAKDIIKTIKEIYPESNTFYDLFCGGLSISEEVYKQGFTVYSSDYDKTISELYNTIITDNIIDPVTGISLSKQQRFIEREEFDKDKNLDNYWGAYLRSCWSFGNKGTWYIYGKDRVKLIKAIMNGAENTNNIKLDHAGRLKRMLKTEKKPKCNTCFIRQCKYRTRCNYLL